MGVSAHVTAQELGITSSADGLVQMVAMHSWRSMFAALAELAAIAAHDNGFLSPSSLAS